MIEVRRHELAVHVAHRVAMLAHDAEERLAVLLVTREWPAVIAGDARRLRIGFTGHHGGDGGRVVTPLIAVVGQAARHQQCAEVRVAETQRPVGMAVPLDRRRRVARVVDQDLLRRDEGADAGLERVDVELAVVADELHQVERRQVARRVVEEHVLGARVAGVDAIGDRAGVPLVDRRVELHAGIAAHPRALGNQPHHLACLVGVDDGAAGHRVGLPGAVVEDGAHELVGDTHRVVRVLEEDRVVGRSRERAVVAGIDQGPRLLLFLDLAIDEFDDVGMVGVEDDHLGSTPRLAARLDHAGKRVVALHERYRTRRSAAAGQQLARRADRRQVRAGA